MRGYEVVASDERSMGRIVDIRRGYLIMESGWLRKLRRPVPREFAHVVDEAAKVFVTVPKSVLMDAPRVRRNGEVDEHQVARHYGLAISYRDTGEQGPAEHRRAEMRKHMRPGFPEEHDPHSPALPGDRRLEEARIRE